jgi:uncharacterized membrane protein
MDQIPQPTPQQPLAPAPSVMQEDRRDIDENKDIAALGYVWILSVFVYIFRHNSPFVRFHAKQGMILFVLSIAFWFVPMFGKVLVLLVLALAVTGFISAGQGQWRELPFIYAVSRGDWKLLRGSWKSAVQSIVQLWQRATHRTGKKDAATAESSATTPASPTPTV